MNDINVRASKLGKGHEMVASLRLHLDRARRFVPLGADLALGDELGLELGDEVRIFTMRGDDGAEFFGRFQRLIEFVIINAKRAFVSEEDFEGSDAFLLDSDLQLRGGGFIEAGDAKMKGVVAGGQASGFAFPKSERFERIFTARGAAHFNQGRGATDQRGFAGGLVVVLGKGAHEGEVDVDVRIDETGEDILAGGIDDFRALWGFEIGADGGDDFSSAEHIGDEGLLGSDDGAVANEEAHEADTITLFHPDVTLAVAEPAGGGGLLFGVKLYAFLALHVEVAKEALIPTREGEVSHGSGHADVHTDHASGDA